ncbi:MAG: aminoglycoside phosphotransferase family protein [Alphaproteobacteria bacterium]|nr:aminoglycoside phosphotransferase family protein [Alphaproteobacteria bacterium]
MDETALNDAIAALWRRSLGPADRLDLTPCPVSGNNRVFVARAGDGREAVAKWYFTGPADRRDRLDAEWRLLAHAARAGVKAVPRPLARDDARRLALHEFVKGDRPTQIGRAEVMAAAALFRALNENSADADLPDAAEACFTAPAHVALMEGRLSRLSAIRPDADVDRQAIELAAAMNDRWRRLRPRLADFGGEAGRCVSPSDFGFHNALRGPDGALRFIDFEYAGWDDPAKTICDFFLQPAVPVDPVHRDAFVAAILDGRPDAAAVLARARLLHPVFALKWCCIMLNPFVADLASPSRFADPAADRAERKRLQLAKAVAAFQTSSSGD